MINLGDCPIAAVWIKLILALPNLKLLIHDPNAVILEVALDAVHKINDAFISFQIELKFGLKTQWTDCKSEQKTSWEENYVSI